MVTATSTRVIRLPILSDLRQYFINWVYAKENDQMQTALRIGVGLLVSGIVSTLFWGIIFKILAKVLPGYTNILAIIALLAVVYTTFYLVDKRPANVSNEFTLTYILGMLIASLFGLLAYYLVGGAILNGMQSIFGIIGGGEVVTQSLMLFLQSLMTTQSAIFVTSQGAIALGLLKLGPFVAYPMYYAIYAIEQTVLQATGLRIE